MTVQSWPRPTVQDSNLPLVASIILPGKLRARWEKANLVCNWNSKYLTMKGFAKYRRNDGRIVEACLFSGKSARSSRFVLKARVKTTPSGRGIPLALEQETQPVYKTKASVTDIDISLNEIPEERVYVYVRSISGCLRSETETCQNVCCIVRNTRAFVSQRLLNASCASFTVTSMQFWRGNAISDFLPSYFEYLIEPDSVIPFETIEIYYCSLVPNRN